MDVSFAVCAPVPMKHEGSETHVEALLKGKIEGQDGAGRGLSGSATRRERRLQSGDTFVT